MEWLVIVGLVVTVVALWNRIGRLERRGGRRSETVVSDI